MSNVDKHTAIEAMRKAARCWAGYEPVPGAKAYSDGSCRPKGSKKTQKEVAQGKKHTEKKAQQPGAYYSGKYSAKPFNVAHARQHLKLPDTLPDNEVYDNLITNFEKKQLTPSQFSEFNRYYGIYRPRFRPAAAGAPSTAVAGQPAPQPTQQPITQPMRQPVTQTAASQPPVSAPTPSGPAVPRLNQSRNDLEYSKWRATQPPMTTPKPNTLSAAPKIKSGGVNLADGLLAKLRLAAQQRGFNAAQNGPADPLPKPSKPDLAVTRTAELPAPAAPAPLKRVPLPLQ